MKKLNLILLLCTFMMMLFAVNAKADVVVITTAKNKDFGHTSVISQDKDGKWFYFYWGDRAAYEKEVPNENMENIDKFNEWIYKVRKIDHELESSNGWYAYSIYIKGDFTKTTQYYSKTVKEYKKCKYSAVFNNCTIVSKRALEKGILEDGKPFEKQIKYSLKNQIPFWNIFPHNYRKLIEKSFENTKYQGPSDWGNLKNPELEALVKK